MLNGVDNVKGFTEQEKGFLTTGPDVLQSNLDGWNQCKIRVIDSSSHWRFSSHLYIYTDI